MMVCIKLFEVEMELKNKGIEFEIQDTDDQFLGDLVITKAAINLV